MTDPSLQNRYRECVRMLYSIAPSFQRVGVSGYHPGLESMTDFARFLGDPHKSLRTIHIAGTNGKGSGLSGIPEAGWDCTLRRIWWISGKEYGSSAPERGQTDVTTGR